MDVNQIVQSNHVQLNNYSSPKIKCRVCIESNSCIMTKIQREKTERQKQGKGFQVRVVILFQSQSVIFSSRTSFIFTEQMYPHPPTNLAFFGIATKIRQNYNTEYILEIVLFHLLFLASYHQLKARLTCA